MNVRMYGPVTIRVSKVGFHCGTVPLPSFMPFYQHLPHSSSAAIGIGTDDVNSPDNSISLQGGVDDANSITDSDNQEIAANVFSKLEERANAMIEGMKSPGQTTEDVINSITETDIPNTEPPHSNLDTVTRDQNELISKMRPFAQG